MYVTHELGLACSASVLDQRVAYNEARPDLSLKPTANNFIIINANFYRNYIGRGVYFRALIHFF